MNGGNRNLTTPNDYGPRAVPRSRISRNGLGARLIYKSNPFSFITDWLGPCLPFLSLQGGQDPASKAARQAALDSEATSVSGGGSSSGGSANTGTKPDDKAPDKPKDEGSGPKGSGDGSIVGYIRFVNGGG